MDQSERLPRLEFDPNSLPLGQLESLRFKAIQIIESIQNLQRTIEFGVQTNAGFIPNALPPWPDILPKYSLLVSQTHTLSNSLSASFSQAAQSNPLPGARPKQQPSNPFEKLALHPAISLPEAQFDNDLIPLLRSQQTVSVLNNESSLVARIQESIKELNAANGMPRLLQSQQGSGQPDHERTSQACDTIRSAHDARVDRARRAVTLLRDKYDWRARVEITFPVTPPPEIPQLPESNGLTTPANDNDETESAYMDNGSSDAGGLEHDQGMDEDEAAVTGSSGYVIDLTDSAAPTPGSMLIDQPQSAAMTPGNIVIDITSSAAPTPGQSGADSDSDMALAGIFTPNNDEQHLLPLPP